MLFERLGCMDYFIHLLAGERAELLDTTNPDWAPTVKLCHDKIKQNVSQLAVSRNAHAQTNENKQKYDEMAASFTSRKSGEMEVVQEKEYVETETSSKCTLSLTG